MFNIKKQPLYDIDAVQPMRDELTYVGFEEFENRRSGRNSYGENKINPYLFLLTRFAVVPPEVPDLPLL
jgi:hypothetical protein